MVKHAMWILWPSFLAGCIGEVLFFALFDPEDLMLFSQTIPLSRLGVYSVGFFFFWFFAALSSAITCMLSRPGSELNAAGRAADSDHEPPPGQAAGNH